MVLSDHCISYRYDNFIWKMTQATLPIWHLKRIVESLIAEETKYVHMHNIHVRSMSLCNSSYVIDLAKYHLDSWLLVCKCQNERWIALRYPDWALLANHGCVFGSVILIWNIFLDYKMTDRRDLLLIIGWAPQCQAISSEVWISNFFTFIYCYSHTRLSRLWWRYT